MSNNQMMDQPLLDFSVLIINDDESSCFAQTIHVNRLLRKWLPVKKHKVDTVNNCISASSMLLANRYDILIVDYNLSRSENGLMFIERIRSGKDALLTNNQELKIILFTGEDLSKKEQDLIYSLSAEYCTKLSFCDFELIFTKLIGLPHQLSSKRISIEEEVIVELQCSCGFFARNSVSKKAHWVENYELIETIQEEFLLHLQKFIDK